MKTTMLFILAGTTLLLSGCSTFVAYKDDFVPASGASKPGPQVTARYGDGTGIAPYSGFSR